MFKIQFGDHHLHAERAEGGDGSSKLGGSASHCVMALQTQPAM